MRYITDNDGYSSLDERRFSAASRGAKPTLTGGELHVVGVSLIGGDIFAGFFCRWGYSFLIAFFPFV